MKKIYTNRDKEWTGKMLIDKVAIITGAAQGLGKAIALRYAREGANIVIADLNKKREMR